MLKYISPFGFIFRGKKSHTLLHFTETGLSGLINWATLWVPFPASVFWESHLVQISCSILEHTQTCWFFYLFSCPMVALFHRVILGIVKKNNSESDKNLLNHLEMKRVKTHQIHNASLPVGYKYGHLRALRRYRVAPGPSLGFWLTLTNSDVCVPNVTRFCSGTTRKMVTLLHLWCLGTN